MPTEDGLGERHDLELSHLHHGAQILGLIHQTFIPRIKSEVHLKKKKGTFLSKLNMELPLSPLRSINPREVKIHVHTTTCT